jgi:hypothetical protein
MNLLHKNPLVFQNIGDMEINQFLLLGRATDPLL